MIAMQGMRSITLRSLVSSLNGPAVAISFCTGVWGAFPTKDGHLCIAASMRALAVRSARFSASSTRKRSRVLGQRDSHFHVTRLTSARRLFPKKTTREWLKELTDADILATEVVDYRAMLKSEQARLNGYLLELDHPVAARCSSANPSRSTTK